MAVFTGSVDPAISSLWNRINLALILHCLPSDIDRESHKDIDAIRVVLNAREEMKEKSEGDNKWQSL